MDAGHENEERTQRRLLCIAAIVEGTTLLVLIGIAMPLRHLGGFRIATQIMGPLHGLAFLTYVWLTIAALSGGGWTRREAAGLLLAAFVPFGGYITAWTLRGRRA